MDTKHTPTKQHGYHPTSSSTAAQGCPSAVKSPFPPTYARDLHDTAGLGNIQAGFWSENGYCQYPWSTDTVSTADLEVLLWFIMVHDYAHTAPRFPVDMPSEFVDHWVQVGRMLAQQHGLWLSVDPQIQEFDVPAIQAYCYEHVIQPARHHNLPTEYVAATISRFSTLVGEHGRMYTGSLDYILAVQGPKHLATKMWFDRNVVIPRLWFPKRSELDRLIQSLDVAQRRYFKALEGAGFKINTTSEAVARMTGWCEVEWEEMVLTEYAKAVVKRTLQAVEHVDEARARFGTSPKSATQSGAIDLEELFADIAAAAASCEVPTRPSTLPKPAKADGSHSVLGKARKYIRRMLRRS
ncbi:uncharacterized protein BKCO1_1000617 [Diplodia corticola]|uniref:Uncharacterized protein n=1 Tax=Diplodia corticola TaxID=236234 RepID=A0A1J9RJT0_9PEZI|nr:uncharacterized protein BKCO1_1000617 [Diplodia corticola]OJD40266.1 hypothetical protein BKCO1_1000617 [Diplodia corticola]